MGWISFGRYGTRGLAALSLLLVVNASASTLTQDTLAAWDEYVQRSRVELICEPINLDGFLWIDKQREKLETVGSHSDVIVYSPQRGGIAIPSGLVHHWIGTVFIQNVRYWDVLAVLQDYDSYQEIYQPAVIESRLLLRGNDGFHYRLKFAQKRFGAKAGLLGEFRSVYSQISPGTGYSVTEATRLVELENAGTARERVLPANASHGYVERMFTIVRYRQSRGGVYVEVETLTLSRDIPAPVRWLVTPVIQRFSRQTVTATLEKLRDRVQARQAFESASSK